MSVLSGSFFSVRRFIFTTSFLLISALAGVASAAPATVQGELATAEICTSTNGRAQIVKGFNGEAFFVASAPERGARPTVHEKHTYKKEAGGVSEMNELDFAMFEMIADMFGGAPKPKDQWKATFEETFEGRVTVFDPQAKVVGTFPMSCNAVTLESK